MNIKRILPIEAVCIINLLILFSVFLLPFLFSNNQPNTETVHALCLLVGFLVVWILLTLSYVSDDVFNFYSLFLVAAIFFNAGQALLEIFHLNPSDILGGRFDDKTLTSTLYLVASALISFHTGGILSASRKQRYKNETHYSIFITSLALRIVGYALLAISIIPAIMQTFEALQIVLQRGYFALYQRNSASGLASGMGGVRNALADFFPPGLLFLLAGSKNHPKIRNITFLMILGYICTLIFLGLRGYATMLLIAGLWVWHRVIKPLPIHKILIGGCILMFIIFPTIHATRNVEGSSRLNPEFLVQTFFSIENPVVNILTEMGNTMETIAYSIQLIPQDRPFAWGTTYAYASSVVIPNLFWDLHPGIKHGNLGNWLTMTVNPYFYSIGGGLGYSFIAEAYANFGFWGTPIMMIIFGFIIAWITRWAASREEYGKIAVVAGCIATMLFWVRADVTIFARPFDYYILPSYISFLFIRKRLRPKT